MRRAAIPEIRIRTTLIVGYPGETEKDFKALTDFLLEMKFDHLGVFTYSEEEGTIGADLEDNISRELKYERKAVIMDIQNNINYEKNSAMVGQIQKVIIDEVGENVSVGRTEFDSPELIILSGWMGR